MSPSRHIHLLTCLDVRLVNPGSCSPSQTAPPRPFRLPSYVAFFCCSAPLLPLLLRS